MKISALLGKLFNVRPGEWPRLAWLYAMSLIALIGLTWGDAIVQAAFLQRVGVQYLPWIFIGSAACSIGAVFIYSAFADRVSNTRLLVGLIVISAAGIVICLALLAVGIYIPAYVLLYLVLNVPLLDLYNVHWATYVNGFYDIRAAKRIVPVLGTAECLSGIIAGFSMPLMNRLLSSVAIIGVMLAMLVVMAVIAATLPRLLRENPAVPLKPKPIDEVRLSDRGARIKVLLREYGANLREGFRQIVLSPFLLWMALSTFSMTVLIALINFAASAIFLEKLKTTVAIADYIGVLSGIANLVVLPLQLFLLSRLISRLGLGNASLIFPMTTLAAVGGLTVAPVLGTAGLAYLDRTALRNAFRLPTDNLLYNAVPQRIKARTRAFIGGLLVPGGAIIGGILLLTPLMRLTWFLPVAMIVLAVTFAIAAVKVRGHYGTALVDLLEQEDYVSLALQPSSRHVPSAVSADPAVRILLAQKLAESTSPERTIFITQLITAVCGETGVPVIKQAALNTADSRLRASLVEVLATAELRGEEVREFYINLLGDPDSQVRLSAINGLEQIEGPRDPRYLEIAAGLLADLDVRLRLRVLPTLLAAADEHQRAAGTSELRALLKSPDPHIRAKALHVVGQARAFGFLMELVRSLTDSEDEVRLAAGLATETLAGDQLLAGKRDMLLVLALLLLHDPIERARLAAVTVLDRLCRESGPSAAAAGESLAAVLNDPSAEVRARTVETLVHIGRRIIPQLTEQLNAAEPLAHKMTAAALARIEPNKYGSLILGNLLESILKDIYQNISCRNALTDVPNPASSVLARALFEQNLALLDEFFYLLSAVRNPGPVDSIATSLRSQLLDERATAVEALETFTGPKLAGLVAPLLDPEQAVDQQLSLARLTWDISCPTPAAAVRQLLSCASDAWQRALAAAALPELSKSVVPVPELEIGELLELARVDSDPDVRQEAHRAAANWKAASTAVETEQDVQPSVKLSLVEKLILIENIPFFTSISIDQLRILAKACEQEFLPAGDRLYKEGDPGGILYVIVSGRVGIERHKFKGSYARLATIDAKGYFGESDLFDGHNRSNSAIAICDTLVLRLRREPLIALARQNPDLSLELIKVLSSRLREATIHIADLTKTHPQILHKLYDQLSEPI